jgi:phenylalanyl-tRNA synthetase alpha chain
MYTLPDNLDFSNEAQVLGSLDAARTAFFDELSATSTPAALEEFRVRWMGDKAGLLNRGIAAWVKALPGDLKRSFGKAFGDFKRDADTALQDRKLFFENAKPVAAPSLDLSLPGLRRSIGVEHPLIRTMREMTAVFAALGYSVGVGPEVESDFYNFEALNFPPNHPARDTQDTLVVADQDAKPLRERLLMRTHTSPVQIRTMVSQAPPLRIVIPGKVHRNDESDATHSPIFHQVEGLCVDTDITFSDLKGTLDYAMKAFFGSSVKTRFFPSFFPFTEPSADVQISCPFCGQKGCRKCKYSGWIELLGCGMVDPAVFAAVDQRRIENGLEPAYDTKKISGFAFGMGVERIAMMKYGVGDIGQFYSGDLRFLSQFI